MDQFIRFNDTISNFIKSLVSHAFEYCNFFYKIIYKFSIHFSRGSFTKRIFAYFEGHLSHSRQQQKLFSLSQEIKKGKYGPNSFLIIFKMRKKADFERDFTR